MMAERQQSLDDLSTRVTRHAERAVARCRVAREALHRRLIGLHPRTRVMRGRAALGPLSARLSAAMQMRLERAGREVAERQGRLESLSPVAVLSRGYAIALDTRGRAVVDAASVNVADAIELRLHRGRLDLTVARVRPESAPTESDGEAAEPRAEEPE
jgi:exodeoxyribonuclease VII large subunit